MNDGTDVSTRNLTDSRQTPQSYFWEKEPGSEQSQNYLFWSITYPPILTRCEGQVGLFLILTIADQYISKINTTEMDINSHLQRKQSSKTEMYTSWKQSSLFNYSKISWMNDNYMPGVELRAEMNHEAKWTVFVFMELKV